jgi:hypothetical protein
MARHAAPQRPDAVIPDNVFISKKATPQEVMDVLSLVFMEDQLETLGVLLRTRNDELEVPEDPLEDNKRRK